MILSLDFADTAIIETIATARTIMAMVPNSGTTCVPIISIFLSFFIDDILINWLDNLSLKNDFSLAIYSPYDWIDTKWALLLIFSITLILPYSSLKMRKFALPGLYPRERKWFTSVIFFTGFIVPVLLYLIWFLAIPTFLNYFDQIGMVNPGQNVISARYDAVSIISLGIGVSWIIIIGILTDLAIDSK